jgi:hypothetical protein
MMVEILSTPGEGEDEIKAKRHAAAALRGIEDAEEALCLWRDHEEEAIDLLDEEPHDESSDIDDELAELRAAASDKLLETPLEDVLAAVEPEIGDE